MDRAILVPIDGSEPAWDALRFALEHHADADITAYHVISTVPVPEGRAVDVAAEHADRLYEARRDDAEELLADAARMAVEYGVDLETAYEQGNPREAILDYADTRDVDQIIMGSHGHTGLTRVLVGSVAEKVSRHAPVPVTIVRQEAVEGD
jgi:nucleotide-binding universal stress UspA family protein